MDLCQTQKRNSGTNHDSNHSLGNCKWVHRHMRVRWRLKLSCSSSSGRVAEEGDLALLGFTSEQRHVRRQSAPGCPQQGSPGCTRTVYGPSDPFELKLCDSLVGKVRTPQASARIWITQVEEQGAVCNGKSLAKLLCPFEGLLGTE